MNQASNGAAGKSVRCAVYTRKSTEEGLNQQFNSLDAQREAAEAYIASQCHEGWLCLPQRYDDGGFTGANMDRPALKRLLDEIQAGKIDCVVVYKVDRLSRSLLDFARMMETFDQQRVAFVSVTQQFNTATSMGRLVLNVLLSFAQFAPRAAPLRALRLRHDPDPRHARQEVLPLLPLLRRPPARPAELPVEGNPRRAHRTIGIGADPEP